MLAAPIPNARLKHIATLRALGYNTSDKYTQLTGPEVSAKNIIKTRTDTTETIPSQFKSKLNPKQKTAIAIPKFPIIINVLLPALCNK